MATLFRHAVAALLSLTGTAKEVVGRLHGETVKALRLADVRERFQAMGLDIVGNSPEQFAAFMQAETAKWGRIVRQSGARID